MFLKNCPADGHVETVGEVVDQISHSLLNNLRFVATEVQINTPLNIIF